MVYFRNLGYIAITNEFRFVFANVTISEEGPPIIDSAVCFVKSLETNIVGDHFILRLQYTLFILHYT